LSHAGSFYKKRAVRTTTRQFASGFLTEIADGYLMVRSHPDRGRLFRA